MKQTYIMKATLGRLPMYLNYLESLPVSPGGTISATAIAKAVGLGDVLVRKDLGALAGTGKPRIGYVISDLIRKLENFLVALSSRPAALVGAGKLGEALLGYGGFDKFNVSILVAFDNDPEKAGTYFAGKPIYPLSELRQYCEEHAIQIGIITVPDTAAQSVCDTLLAGGVRSIWSFAPTPLIVPDDVLVQHENLALSLAYLNLLTNDRDSG